MKKYIFIIIFLLTIPVMAHQVVEIRPAFAEATKGGLSNFHYLAQVRLETGLPGVPGGQLPAGQELPSYINYLFIFGLGLIAFLALGQMMLGGINYILAAGNVAKVEDAKNTIQQALLGLGLLLVSYLLLRTINPDLVNLRNPVLAPQSFNTQTGGNIITGSVADNSTYRDIINAPDGTVFVPSGGGSITHSGNTIIDCDIFGNCVIHPIK